MSIKINFKDIPQETPKESPEPGRHQLLITDAREETAGTGTEMIQLDYDFVGYNVSLRYDNCPLKTKAGAVIPFGHKKLEKIIEATGLIVGDEVDSSVLIKLLKGKTIEADLVRKEGQKYLEIDGTKIYPVASDLVESAQQATSDPFMGAEIDEDDDI